MFHIAGLVAFRRILISAQAPQDARHEPHKKLPKSIDIEPGTTKGKASRQQVETAKLRYQIRKMLCYTLYCTTVVLVHLLQPPALSHSTICTHLVAGVGVALPLADDHGLEVLALGHLGLDLLDVLGEVGCVLHAVSPEHSSNSNSVPTYILGLGPLLLGQELVAHGQLRYLSLKVLIFNSRPYVPGKHGADGKRGRRPPGVGGA